MIPENEMNLTDRDVAHLIATMVYKMNLKKGDYALQLFIETLVVPKDCDGYDVDELTECIMDFMGEHETD